MASPRSTRAILLSISSLIVAGALTANPASGATVNPCAQGWTFLPATPQLAGACQVAWSTAKPNGTVVIPSTISAGQVRITGIGGDTGEGSRDSEQVGEVTGLLDVVAGDVVSVVVGTVANPRGTTADTSVVVSRASQTVASITAAGAASTLRANEVPTGFVSGYQRADSAALSTVTLSYAVKSSATATAFRVTTQQGPTPFIAYAFLDGINVSQLTTVTFTISPRPGATVPALTGTFTRAGLQSKGYLDNTLGRVVLPIYGLYAGRSNTIKIGVSGIGGGNVSTNITTPVWDDPHAQVFADKQVLQARDPKVHLDYSYVLLKYFQGENSPVVLDIDGDVRWIGPTGNIAQSVALVGNAFLLGSPRAPEISRVDFDGRRQVIGTYANLGVLGFHHNADPGKTGFIFETDRPNQIESTAVEINADGSVAGVWDVEKIIAEAMRSGGDDPTRFVRPGADWCHMNSATYWKSTDQIVVSCREQFVIGIDYTTSTLRWILGDPTKSWATYPSLRALALKVTGNAPVGQHALSFTSKTDLMLFDNGLGSLNAGPGEPAGVQRNYSAPRRYRIDVRKGTATEVWTYERSREIYSPITSSIYQFSQSFLINYAAEQWARYVRLVGLSSSGKVAFDYRWTGTVSLGWNAVPFNLSGRAW